MPHASAIASTNGFNGAALFQSGEHEQVVVSHGLDFASMGPLFFRAENPTVGHYKGKHPCELQWGRSFSERRTIKGLFLQLV